MNSVNDNLSRLLDMNPQDIITGEIGPDGFPLAPPREPAVLDIKEKESSLSDRAQNDMIQDYIYARSLNYTLLNEMGNLLASAMRVAVESENSKSYEAANSLAITVMNIQKELLGLQKTFKEVLKDNPEHVPPSVVNNTQNNISFSGTTAELMAIIQEQEEQSKHKIIDIE